MFLKLDSFAESRVRDQVITRSKIYVARLTAAELRAT
jgi:hypothetical protein